METLDLVEAAKFLKMTPPGLRRKAASGIIPGAKPGKQWVFVKDDLVSYLRAQYDKRANMPISDKERRKKCHSMKETVRGGFQLVTRDDEYSNLLGLRTR